MKLLKKIVLVLAVIIGAILVAAIFIKKDYSTSRSVVINQPISTVFGYVKLLQHQNDYSKWAGMDPQMEKTYTGTDGKVGFISAWKSEKKEVGSGEQEITAIVDNQRIDYNLRFKEPFESNAKTYITTEAISENQTKVTWGFSGSMNYPLNFLRLFINMEKMIGADFQTGLDHMKVILEK